MNFQTLIEIFLHLDKYLGAMVNQNMALTYGLLFLIIFCETGLVITPFLPGDSLIFALGALVASAGLLGFPLTLLILYVAAILGDTVNYEIGKLLHNKVENNQRIPFVKMEHIDKTRHFFDKYGSMTIVIARFIPIIRTFAPFVAGVGAMRYRKFLAYNAIGGISWVTIFLTIGYFFGNLPFVKDHFSLVVLGIIAISVMPVAYTILNHYIMAFKLKKTFNQTKD
jgi:membrane-associated protein